MIRWLWVHNTATSPPTAFAALKGVQVVARPQYEMAGFEGEGFDGIMIPMHADQRHLAQISPALVAFLDGGGAMIVNGHIAHPFLPELRRFAPAAKRDLTGLTIRREVDHPLFAGVPTDALTFTKGVAGFYGRGGNPAPPEATVIHTVGRERLPVDWLLQRPSGGRLFVHTGNDIFPFLDRVGALERFLHSLGSGHAEAGCA